MTDVTTRQEQEDPRPPAADEQLLRELTERARAGGLQLTGEDGLLGKLTKMVLEGALEGELDDHLGYAKNDPAGRNGGNSRNGHRAKTVLTGPGPVQVSVPRDRDSSFGPQIVRKRQRRLTGVDEIVLSLYAKGLSTGEISAHFAEIYGAAVSKETVSRITDKVLEEMAAWQARPLEGGADSTGRCESWSEGIPMPRYAPNKRPAAVKRRYFELIRTGLSGSQAAKRVGVSLSCGSLWFIDAGRVDFIETPTSPRYLSQDDRIEIADGLARDEPVKQIAARIGKSYQSVYRELARNREPDGRYQPWYAHNQAYLRRRRPKPRRLAADAGPGGACAPRPSMRRSTGAWLSR